MGVVGRPSRLSSVFGFAAAGIVALVAISLLVTAIQVGRTLVSVSSDPLRDVDVRVFPSRTPGVGLAGMFARGERVNVLLLGYGGAGHDGAYLTDSLMLASIEPRSGVVTLLSLPRDLWVTVAKSTYASAYAAKVNEAFAIPASRGDRDEAIRVAVATLGPVLGVRIDRTVAIDFRAFRTVVDAIGGIDVTVDRSFGALYPKSDDPDVDPSWIAISFRAGPQHMDGETALRFARARYSDSEEGTDFARAARQQKVILATKDRVVSSDSFTKLFGLLEALRENVRTDLSLSDMETLVSFARRYDDSKTVRAALTPDNVLQHGISHETGYALWPKVEGWSEVHAYVRRVIEHAASFGEDPPVAVVVSPRHVAAGLAAVERLADLGFRARLEYADGDDESRTTISDGTGGRGETSALFLAGYFGGALVADPSSTGRIAVHLGSGWAAPIAFDAPLETPAPEPARSAEPSAAPAPTLDAAPDPSARPTPPPTRTPRPTFKTPNPTLRP